MTPLQAAEEAVAGPFASGLPADALNVDYPPIQDFGLAEIRRAGRWLA